MNHTLRLTEANFEEEVLGAETPILVEFWASWCPPCKMVEPVLMELAEEYAEKVKIGKLHVDQNPKTASKYRIMGVPTFMVFHSGKEVQRRMGAQSKEQLRQMLSEVVQESS